MKENEKLIEAAQLIQDHCEQVEAGAPCCFAAGGICDGYISNCRIGKDNFVPSDWDIPRFCRWTEADIALAKALMAFGADRVKRIQKLRDYSAILFKIAEASEYSFANEVPKGAFSSLKPNETMMLADIVAEGENNG